MTLKRLFQATTAAALLSVAALVVVQPGGPRAEAQSAPNPPVCDRTPQIRDAIVKEISEVSDCADVTAAHLEGLQAFGASGSGLSELREGDFNGMVNVRLLALDDNNLTTLPPGIFRGLVSLEILQLTENQLHTLETRTFNGLTRLEFLFLYDSQVMEIKGVFEDLASLTHLDLSRNRLSSVPEGVFANLRALEGLELQRNELRTLADGVFQGLTNLENLELGASPALTYLYLHLEHSPGSSSDATVRFPVGAPFELVVGLSATGGTIQQAGRAIQSVRIAKGSVESEPFQIVPDAGVDSVDVTITTPDLPETICGGTEEYTLPCYEGFALVSAPLAQSDPDPPVCDRTPQVRDAILEQILGVSDCAEVTAEQLAVLVRIWAGGAGISKLREGDFNGMASLEDLGLFDNSLSAIPPGIFQGLNKLETLQLWTNQLSSLEPGTFDGLTSLVHLDLTLNPITSLPEAIFSDLKALTYLNMNSNNLEELDPNQFRGLDSLEYLSLAGHRLTSLPNGVFRGLSALVELELGGSELKSIPGDVFQGLTNLESLYLVGNRHQRLLPAGILEGLVSLEAFTASSDLYFYLEYSPGSLTEAKVTFPVGAPYDMSVGLSASGGTVQRDGRRILSVRIEKGAVESEPFQIVPNAGAEGVSVTITPPDVPDTMCESKYTPWAFQSACYRGFDLHDGQTTPEPPIDHRSVAIWNLLAWNEATSDIDFWAYTKQDVARITEIDFPPHEHCPGESILPGDFNDFVNVRIIRLPATCDLADLQAGAFSGLSGLEELVLDNVGLQSSDLRALEGLDSLRELSLVGNSFDTLGDDAFQTLGALESLNLSGSGITAISEDTFAGLGSLRELRLLDNALTTLPSGAFNDLANLETLILNRNQISSLPGDAFDGLSNLETLLLGGNEVSELQPDVFRELTKLRGLSLAVNELQTLPDGLLDGLTALEAFDVLAQRPLTTSVEVEDGIEFTWVNMEIPVSLVRTRGSAPVARVVFPVGAPWDIDVGLRAVGGTITKNGVPIDSITIPTGHTKSPIFDIEPDDESTRIVIEIDPVIGPPGEPDEVVYTVPDEGRPHKLFNFGLDIVADTVAPITLPDTGGWSLPYRAIAMLLATGVLLVAVATVALRASTATRRGL